MAKDAEIEQVLSLSKEKCRGRSRDYLSLRREKLRNLRREEAESPLCLRITDDSARANLTFMGANAKYMGANAAIVTFAPTIPCHAQRNLYH